MTGNETGKPTPQRKIIHIDMDCFYAAVEMRDRPELRGKPVAVGGSPEGRGVVATASYEARKFGVRSAIASATAVRLCPELIIVRPDFGKYKKESRAVRAILERFTSRIEPLSLDEAYLDVSGSEHFGGSATRIAEEIRRLIREETGLTASAGVAPNKFLAKIASDLNKPNGISVIRPAQIEAFMKTLPVAKIWGVGKVTAEKMKRKGIHTCGDLQTYSVAQLTTIFGSWGVQLYDYARGIDRRPVREERQRKSLSVEETYWRDLQSVEECVSKLTELYDDWNERAVRAQIADRIRGIFVKLKFSDFQHTTHECIFTGYPKPSDFEPLLREAFARRNEPVRLIGIGARLQSTKSKSPTPQLPLW
jgi:DNA polymerase IV